MINSVVISPATIGGRFRRIKRISRNYLADSLLSRGCFLMKQKNGYSHSLLFRAFVRFAGFDVENRKNWACLWSAVSVCSSLVIITRTTPSRVRFSLFPPFGPYYAIADDVINQRSRRQISFGPDPSYNVISSCNTHRVHVPTTSLLFFRYRTVYLPKRRTSVTGLKVGNIIIGVTRRFFL